MRKSMNRSGNRRGFTLVEVIVAMTILTGSMLAMGAFYTRFTRTVTDDTIKAQAVELASNRLEQVKAATIYANIAADFTATETNIPLYSASFSRQTLVNRIGGRAGVDVDDYTIVTVIVTSPVLVAPVRKSTIISVF